MVLSLEKEVDYVPGSGLAMHTTGFKPIGGEPLPSEFGGGFGSDGKGLFGIGGLGGLSSGISSKDLGTSKYDPPGKPYGLPSPYEPAKNYGFGGPGEARTIYPGLVERTRPAHESHGWSLHSHTDTHSIFNDDFFKPIKKKHHFL